METFIVRVFVTSDLGSVPFCGVVQQVGTGRSEPFSGIHDLISIFLGGLERDGDPKASQLDEPERASRE